MKDIGLVAVEGGWEVYVGGAAGATRAQGRPARDGRHDGERRSRLALDVPAALPRARASTSSAPTRYIERVGIDAIQAAVLDEASGEPALRERFRIAKAARRSGPVARAPRPGPPQAVLRARHRAAD